ncbi:MAG TPA: acylphosphatase [Candidatus Dormibacteraeota bacterium]
MAERMRAVIHGDVQGVGFRDFVERRARGLGLTGTVRNRGDGAVEVVAEGDKAALENLKQHLREGPRMAIVSQVELNEEAATGEFDRFEIAW